MVRGRGTGSCRVCKIDNRCFEAVEVCVAGKNSGDGAWRRFWLRRRLRAGAKGNRAFPHANESHQGNSLRGCNRNRGTRSDHRGSQGGRAGAEIILSARSGEHERLQHWRKYRDQRRWPALFEIRRDAQLRRRSRSRARAWPSTANWRPRSQKQNGLQLNRLVCRIGRNAWCRDGDYVAATSVAAGTRDIVRRICNHVPSGSSGAGNFRAGISALVIRDCR